MGAAGVGDDEGLGVAGVGESGGLASFPGVVAVGGDSLYMLCNG